MAVVLKKNKLLYYAQSYGRYLFPAKPAEQLLIELSKKISPEQKASAEKRVDYYNKVKKEIPSLEISTTIHSLRHPKTPKTYYFDTYEHARHFERSLPLSYVFGDVVHVPEFPSIVKSRPVGENNQNSVLLNLDQARHFIWIKNDKDFLKKKDILIGRCAVYQEHRYRFFEKYFGNPLCDLAQVNTKGGNTDWYQPKISLQAHLEAKFILSLEGNDVATNLKWIMSSNSIAVMPKPKYETWFMEGSLIGGEHYIEIKDDYSDLEEQLQYYIQNPDECLQILENAHKHCEQFYHATIEKFCSLKVLERYFKLLD